MYLLQMEVFLFEQYYQKYVQQITKSLPESVLT